MKLGRSPLGEVDLLAARELELGPVESPNHMLLLLQLGVDGHYDLADVDPGHCGPWPLCPWAFQRHHRHLFGA